MFLWWKTMNSTPLSHFALNEPFAVNAILFWLADCFLSDAHPGQPLVAHRNQIKVEKLSLNINDIKMQNPFNGCDFMILKKQISEKSMRKCLETDWYLPWQKHFWVLILQTVMLCFECRFDPCQYNPLLTVCWHLLTAWAVFFSCSYNPPTPPSAAQILKVHDDT